MVDSALSVVPPAVAAFVVLRALLLETVPSGEEFSEIAEPLLSENRIINPAPTTMNAAIAPAINGRASLEKRVDDAVPGEEAAPE